MTSRVLGLTSYDIAEEIANEFKLTEAQEERCAQIVRKHLCKLPETLQKIIDSFVLGAESAGDAND